MRFLFACGGTGGHINPAIAVAKLIEEKRKESEILFVGVNGGMETRLVPDSGFAIKTIDVSGVSRKKGIGGLVSNISAVKKLFSAEKAARRILEEFKPDVVIGTGGYACYPTLRSATRLGIPTVVHEANAYPGLATRRLAKAVTRVLLNFEAGAERLPKKTSFAVVGNPIRGDILLYDREKAREELGITKPLLVSFWGSLGAREMNNHIAEFMRLEKESGCDFCHIHACGKFGYEWMPALLEEKGVTTDGSDGIWLREYIDDMPRVLAAADVVMCRGGAGTLSEIGATGKPAIIVPSPNVTDNHQYKNALELKKIGGAIVFEEKDVTPSILLDAAKELLSDAEKRSVMSSALVENAVLDASEKIYSEIMNVIKRK